MPGRIEPDLPPRRRHEVEDPVEILIPYRNGKALAAYYCGVFSLIPCVGIILGPLAFALGIMGLRFANANPSVRGKGHAVTGIVLGSIATLGNGGVIVLMLIGIGMGAVGG